MKKLSIITILMATTGILAACGQISQNGLCDDQQTLGCAPYTNERTAMAKTKPVIVETVEVVEEVVVVEEPIVEEEVVIQSAEPQFNQISK